METIELNGRLMRDRKSAHDHLQTQLSLPDYYGRNLDALYDLLTERSDPTRLLIRFSGELEADPCSFAAALLDTLRDAAASNPSLEIELADQ